MSFTTQYPISMYETFDESLQRIDERLEELGADPDNEVRRVEARKLREQRRETEQERNEFLAVNMAMRARGHQ